MTRDDKATEPRWSEFDCPVCEANNPSDTFGPGDEVFCTFCGSGFAVAVGASDDLVLEPL